MHFSIGISFSRIEGRTGINKSQTKNNPFPQESFLGCKV